jgi:hypothetical protein
MNREEFANKWAAVEIYEDGLPISIVIQARYNDLLADLDSLSLPPAEGAEKSCLSCRFHNSPTYHDKMWCRDCQQLSHYEQQPTAEGTGKTCHAKEMEYNHNMCAMQESCEKCEAYKVPTNEGDIAKIETDTGRIVDMPDLSQLTAEGAEEILAKIPFVIKHNVKCYEHEDVIAAMQEFAALHAQRIAEKMVEERSEFIKKAVIRFFYTEVDLNFCTREYRDRVEWYFNTYQHEIFKLPKTSLDNFKSREK